MPSSLVASVSGFLRNSFCNPDDILLQSIEASQVQTLYKHPFLFSQHCAIGIKTTHSAQAN